MGVGGWVGMKWKCGHEIIEIDSLKTRQFAENRVDTNDYADTCQLAPTRTDGAGSAFHSILTSISGVKTVLQKQYVVQSENPASALRVVINFPVQLHQYPLSPPQIPFKFIIKYTC